MSTAPSLEDNRDFVLIEETAAICDSASTPAYAERAFRPVDSWRYCFVKRGIDFSGAVILSLLFLAPGMLIALAIYLSSPGAVFYREERVGRNGRPFRIWKFRSMHQHAPRLKHISSSKSNGYVPEWRMRKDLKDPRITPVGWFLRRLSLDELPQLLNVLSGEMSLVGPRPIVSQEMKFYGELLPHYLAAIPGMSGLWQVSGRSDIDYDKRAMMDASYVESWSLKLDFDILCRTIPAVLSRSGAA